MNNTRLLTASFLVLSATLFAITSLRADPRRYVYTYGSSTMPAGDWELEQWLTWKHYDSKDRIDFRHEFEFGITDRLQAALYIADWRWEKRDGTSSRTTYQDTAIELQYSLTDPVEDFLGSALYGEVKLGDEKFVLESKLILEKAFGPFWLGYNFTLEAEWEGSDYSEDVGVIENSLGLSYQVSPSLLVGAEMLHEVAFDDWEDRGSNVISIGPNISWRRGDFWITAAALFQASDLDDEPRNQLRVLAAWKF